MAEEDLNQGRLDSQLNLLATIHHQKQAACTFVRSREAAHLLQHLLLVLVELLELDLPLVQLTFQLLNVLAEGQFIPEEITTKARLKVVIHYYASPISQLEMGAFLRDMRFVPSSLKPCE